MLHFTKSWGLALIPVLSACGRGPIPELGDGTDGEPSICSECPDQAWVCKCTNLDVLEVCEEITLFECDYTCTANMETVEDHAIITCADNSNYGSCSGWNPAGNVALVGGVYEVDKALLATLTNGMGSAPLWTCDDAVIEPIVGGFQIASASSGELLYELGLRNGDKPVTINGISVSTWSGALSALDVYLDGETEFTVVVIRNGTPHTLSYELAE